MESFNNCNCEGQSNSQFMNLFPISKPRGWSHIFRSYYWWQLHPIFSLVFPLLPSLQVVPFSLCKNATGCPCRCLQWTACTVKGLFLKIQVLNPFSAFITTFLVTIHPPCFQPQCKIVHISRSAPHSPISHQHMPKSCRGTKQERIWDWSGAACFPLASQEATAQSLSETHRTDKYWGHTDFNLGLPLFLFYL